VLVQEKHLIAARYAIHKARHELELADVEPADIDAIRALHRILFGVLELLEPYLEQTDSKHI